MEDKDAKAERIKAEVRALKAQGVHEVTGVGKNTEQGAENLIARESAQGAAAVLASNQSRVDAADAIQKRDRRNSGMGR